jgi:intein/homing endonuclease
MGDGSYKKIGDINIGDYVVSGKGNNKKCINKFEFEVDEELVEIELETGEKIECTKDHKILINNGHGEFWKKAGELILTDNIVKVK